MPVHVNKTAVPGSIVAFIVSIVLALLIGRVSPLESIVVAVGATVLHWLHVCVHQYGHYTAARLTGHPMSHARISNAAAQSDYPPDEDEDDLSARTHIQRAAGGPIASLLWNLPLLGLLLVAGSGNDLIYTIAALALIDNFFAFTIFPALIPVNLPQYENDISTIIRTMRKQN
jgi:hypothetical protein